MSLGLKIFCSTILILMLTLVGLFGWQANMFNNRFDLDAVAKLLSSHPKYDSVAAVTKTNLSTNYASRLLGNDPFTIEIEFIFYDRTQFFIGLYTKPIFSRNRGQMNWTRQTFLGAPIQKLVSLHNLEFEKSGIKSKDFFLKRVYMRDKELVLVFKALSPTPLLYFRTFKIRQNNFYLGAVKKLDCKQYDIDSDFSYCRPATPSTLKD